MNNATTDKVRVLILEDDKTYIGIAKAGLFPKDPSGRQVTDEQRVKLAKEYFQIEHSFRLSEFFECLENFEPDIFLIDIVLKKGQTCMYDNVTFKDGLDVFRYVRKKYKRSVSLMFSNKAHEELVNQEIKNDEWQFCILKGTGFGNLANKMPDCLEQVLVNIISMATDDDKEDILKALTLNKYESIKSNVFSLGKRKLLLAHLLIHKSFPVKVKGEVVLNYSGEAIDEIFRLLQRKVVQGGSKRRQILKNAPQLLRAFRDYEGKFRSDHENEYVIPGIKEVIELLAENSLNKPHEILGALKYKHFRIIAPEYADATIRMHSTFRVKFLNHLIIRRIIFVIEQFLREHVDRNDGRTSFQLRSTHSKFFNAYISHFFAGIKGKVRGHTKVSLNQIGMQLNLGFSFNENNEFREVTEIDKYPIEEFETEWLRGRDCTDLISYLREKVLVS